MNQLLEWVVNFFRGSVPWVIVLAWERGVRVRLGKRTQVLEPGIHWRIPYVDEVRTLNTRLRITTFPCATVSTKDGAVVTAAGSIGFRITDPLAAFMAMSQPDNVLAALGQSVAAEIIAGTATARDLDIATVEARALDLLVAFAQTRGLGVEWFRFVDFARVRTYRLLQDQWRPQTSPDTGH